MDLWCVRYFYTDLPVQYSFLFYNGKNVCLRGREERRQLHIPQIKRFTDPDHYVYYEYCSKNRAGTFQQKHVDPKTVPIIYCTCTVNSTERCHVHLLDLYLKKLQRGAIEADVFYMRPLDAVPKDTSRPWFTNCPVGRNTLAAVVKKMCKEVGIEGKTNHSLRATGATELFQAEVPGRLIQQRTGHCSVKALRVYERTTAEQHENISAILSSSSSIQYSAPSITHLLRQGK